MYKSLAYKEWLKVRWFALGALGLEIIVLIYIFSSLRATIEFNSAVNIWSAIIYKNFMFFQPLQYLPLFIGLGIGIAQYLPEVSEQKLKLTLHLPLKENIIFLFLNLFGTLLLLALFLPVILILIIGSSTSFPSEIINATILTIIPWFVSAFVAYYFVAAIMIEPLWSRKVLLAVLGYIFVTPLLKEVGYGAYTMVLFALVIIAFFFSPLNLLSGIRFKRGAK
jgi:hypothetical protein